MRQETASVAVSSFCVQIDDITDDVALWWPRARGNSYLEEEGLLQIGISEEPFPLEPMPFAGSAA